MAKQVRRKITQQELQRLALKPGVHMVEYQHDDTCPTLKTGRGFDCNCKPNIYLVTLKGK